MKKKWIAFGIVAALLIAVLVIVLRFTKKQTNGITDGKYMAVDCPEYPDAYIIVKNNSIQIKNSIFRNSLIFQGLPPIKYQNLMYFPLFLPL